jgi:beta-carotene 15,15'-dioxygenase
MTNPLKLSSNFYSFFRTESFSLKAYLLLFGIALVIFHNFIFQLPENIQWIIFIVTMLITGIPHGAIDHLVDEQNELNAKKAFSMSSFLKKYISKMLVYGLIWWFFPILAITIFIGISAYHFGETDLLVLPKNSKSEKFLFLSYGWLLLNVLFLTHFIEVVSILNSLPGFFDGFTQVLILLLGKFKIPYFAFCLAALCISTLNYSKSENSLLPVLSIFLQGVVIVAICAQLPFLLAFAFYFGLWHSLLCFQSIRQYILENQQVLAWKQVARKALLFSLIAIFGLVFLILIGNLYSQTSFLLFWLFIGIAILTAPHMSVMSTMFSAMKRVD